MNENQNVMQNQTVQSTSPINWERLEALMASVWEQSKETDRRIQETDRQLQETDRQLQESRKEFEKSIQDTRKEFKKSIQDTRKEFKKSMQESRKEFEKRMEESRKEDAKRRKEDAKRRLEDAKRRLEEDKRRKEDAKRKQELDKQLQETDKQIRQLSKEVHHLMKRSSLMDNQWGRFLEEMCVPAAIDIFMKEGIGITQRYTGITHAKDDEGHEMEVDAILCNTTEAVALEVKADCSVKDIDHFVKQLKIFKKVFHPFDKFNVYAAIVGVKFQHGAKEYARKKGLYVIDCTAEGIFSLAMKPSIEKRLCL